MTLPIRLRAEAEQDLDEAARWYESQQPGLGRQFLDEVLLTLNSVAEQPLLYPLVERNARRALVRRFPFGVFYLVRKDDVVVIAVLHGSRDPRRWKSRT